MKNQSLTDLYLAYNEIDYKGVSALAEALKVNTSLRFLNLNDNLKIGNTGAHALYDALKTNTTLTNLSLVLTGVNSEFATELRSICEARPEFKIAV